MINLIIIFLGIAVNRFLPQLIAFTAQLEMNCEILMIDDGSRDDLVKVFNSNLIHLPENTVLRLIQFSRNFGKEAALTAGLKESKGALVAMMDADGQHPISILSQMLDLIKNNNVEVVAAVQNSRQNETLVARIFKKCFYCFMEDTHRYQLTPNAGLSWYNFFFTAAFALDIQSRINYFHYCNDLWLIYRYRYIMFW